MPCTICKQSGHNRKTCDKNKAPVVHNIVTAHTMSSERLKKQKDFIQNKIVKCKQFEKYGLTLIDTNTTIINSLTGELRNMVNTFFKGGLYGVKECEHCGTTISAQYERAHDKGKSRNVVALDALRRIRPDETKSIKQQDFMRAFIEEHTNVPLWILCKQCHINYDK